MHRPGGGIVPCAGQFASPSHEGVSPLAVTGPDFPAHWLRTGAPEGCSRSACSPSVGQSGSTSWQRALGSSFWWPSGFYQFSLPLCVLPKNPAFLSHCPSCWGRVKRRQPSTGASQPQLPLPREATPSPSLRWLACALCSLTPSVLRSLALARLPFGPCDFSKCDPFIPPQPPAPDSQFSG